MTDFETRVKAARLHLPVKVVKAIDEKQKSSAEKTPSESVQSPAPKKEPSSPSVDFETRVKAARLHLPVKVVKAIDEKQKAPIQPSVPPGPTKKTTIIPSDVIQYTREAFLSGGDRTQKTIALFALSESKKGSPYGVTLPKSPLKTAKTKYFKSHATKMTIQQWLAQQPGPHPVYIPSSEYGPYDVVRVGYPVEDESGEIVPGYLFEYSPEARHKIQIAGSIDNYNQYLKEVRSKQFLPIVNAIFGKSLNIDLALASNKPGITGASEREEILIKLLHDYKGSPEGGFDPGRFAMAAVQSPFVQIPISFGAGAAIGKVGGRVSGYLAARYGPRAVQAFNLAQIATGGALTYPQVKSIADKAAKGKTGEAAEQAAMLALLFASGIAGYRYGQRAPVLFGKSKGLTSWEAGFKRGLGKSKIYDPLQKEYFNLISKIKQDLRLRKIMPIQEEPTFTNVKALEQYNQQRANTLRTVIKNQLIALKNRAQITGGAGTEKPSTHDIDELFRSAKDPVVLEYIARKLGIDPNQVFDPHQLPRTGSIIDLTGTPKESPYVYPSGPRGIRLTEQFYRLATSGGQLAHKGRIKDIPEAIRMLNLVYSKTGGIPKKMLPTVKRFLEISAIFEQDPRMMNPAMSQLLYSSGIGKKLWNVRTKFYRKVLLKTYLEKQFNALSNSDLNLLQNAITMQQSGGMPPSLSMAFSDPSYMMSGWASFFSNLARSSGSSAPSTQPSYISQPGYPPSPSPQPYRPPRTSYPSHKDSSYPPPSEQPSISPPYSPKDSSYISPSEQPSLYPYYPSDSYSYFYPNDPIPPELFFFPGMGGKIRSKGRAKPFSVRYYNEYEAVQRLLRNVVF